MRGKTAILLFKRFSLCANSRKLRSAMLLTTMVPMLSYANVDAKTKARNEVNTMEVASSEKKEVTGIVKDRDGLPIIGVNVIIEGTSTGTITDLDGKFTLPVEEGATIVLSYIGCETQKITIGSKTSFDITLKEDSQSLEEVVVVGFGSQKKVNVTGAITQVGEEQLKERPVQNVTQALQGVVPGLNLTSNSSGGELNGSMNINIRGVGTIGEGSNSSPLVLIDGMEGSLSSINPQDIESISVLKDAAASAIYGSRAPFGVILVTTKKGAQGRTVINYNNNIRINSPMGLQNMMDSYSFAQFFNEAQKNKNGGYIFDDKTMEQIKGFQDGTYDGPGTNEIDGGYWGNYNQAYSNTDWFDVHYKDFSVSQDHNISVSGGNEKVQYRVAGNFMNSNGILEYSDDQFNRYALTAKINAKLHDKINMTYSSRWTREAYDRASYQTGLFYHNIARRWPTNPVTDPNGHYMDHSEILQLQDGGRDKNEKDILAQQLRFDFELLEGWKVIAEGNYKTTVNNSHWEILPVYAYNTDNEPFAISWNGGGGYSPGQTRVYEGMNKDNFMGTNIFTEYARGFGEHNFKAMVGFNAELNKGRSIGAQRDGLITPTLPSLNVGTSNQQASGGYNHWATAGFFGRINYDYKEKYLFEVNARYDGSSRFMRDQRWNVFPSFSAGWNIAREDFWADKTHILNTFKLRGSWGELGNQNTSSLYPFYQTQPFGAGNGGWLVNGEKPNTAGTPGLVSADLTWERVQSWNIGLDFGALNNRLTGTFDFFVRNSLNMVAPGEELPVILGTGVPSVNNADMVSKGFELEISWRDRIGEVGYGVRGVLSDARQKVTRYSNPTNNIDKWYEGRYSGDYWGYTTKGMAKSDEEMNNHLTSVNQNALGSNWAAGDIMYEDLNGDGRIDSGKNQLGDSGDKSIIGNSTPRYNFGLTLDANWKGFDVSVFFQGVGKRDYWVDGPYFWGASGDEWQSTGFVEHYDFFRPEGHELGANLDAYYPRPIFGEGSKNQQRQTGYMQNAAYIRLKNAQIGYTFPSTMVQRIGFQSLRLFVSGENLWTGTKMTSIFDPEAIGGSWGDGKLYPLARVVSFGLNVNF